MKAYVLPLVVSFPLRLCGDCVVVCLRQNGLTLQLVDALMEIFSHMLNYCGHDFIKLLAYLIQLDIFTVVD